MEMKRKKKRQRERKDSQRGKGRNEALKAAGWTRGENRRNTYKYSSVNALKGSLFNMIYVYVLCFLFFFFYLVWQCMVLLVYFGGIYIHALTAIQKQPVQPQQTGDQHYAVFLISDIVSLTSLSCLT